MPRRADRERSYLLRFAVTAFLLVSVTLVLVLFVLPERYVLESGFRESGMTFPTPRTPFAPVSAVRVAARPLPRPPAPVPTGPAESFWEDVTPLLEDGRYAEALEDFREYLRDYPGDRDARREYTITLLRAGRPDEAVRELRGLLDEADDFEQRLILARTLRELDRMGEAAVEYRALVDSRPDDVELWLEWASAHAWIEEYDEAAEVLEEALARHPDSVPVRVELARVEFSRDGLEAAAALLADIGDADLAAVSGLELRDAVSRAVSAPEFVPTTPPPPSLLAQAQLAREADDFERSVELFVDALDQRPSDPAIWQAYADLLEYELGDFEGAHVALLEVERLTAYDPTLQYRLTQIEIWTGRSEDARGRLLALLPNVGSEPPVTAPDVQATLGDLDRWTGDRVAAAGRYELALAGDPEHRRALDGLAFLEAEVTRIMVAVEEPRIAATSYALEDTDDFARLDAGVEWVEIVGDWKWGGAAGNRWLGGQAPGGVSSDVRHGVYVDLEAARWWRWGTLRSALQLGFQRVLGGWDYTLGGSLAHRGSDGSQTEIRYEHGPAYPLTATLQSAVAGVVQDHLSVSHARGLRARWTLSATANAALLGTESDDRTLRLQAALALGRELSPSLTLGLSANALRLSRDAPSVTDPVTSAQLRLFWDPSVALSAGPFVRLDRALSSTWSLTGSLGSGIALIDEREVSGWDVVPHLSAEAGVDREGERFWTSLDLFFLQSQFDGYRMYGARVSISARDWSRLGGG